MISVDSSVFNHLGFLCISQARLLADWRDEARNKGKPH